LLISAIGLVTFAVLAVAAARFIKTPTPKGQKLIDTLAGVWVLVCYAAAGYAPLLP
jgi:4-hydroxybenzoate polyprenyltransferase